MPRAQESLQHSAQPCGWYLSQVSPPRKRELAIWKPLLGFISDSRQPVRVWSQSSLQGRRQEWYQLYYIH